MVCAVGEILRRVIDDVVGSEGPDQVDLGRAAHARDFGAEGLGNLDGKAAYSTRRPDDQYLLACLHLARSRTACRAATPETGTAAACSKDRFAGLGARKEALARTYSAKEPSQVP